MTRDGESFSKEDYKIFMQLCQKLGIKQAQFDRFKNNQFKLETIYVEPIEPVENVFFPKLTLVR